MDRNTITGLGLIAVILIGFGYFNQPSDEQKAQIRHERDSIAQVMREDSARQATLVALQKEKAQTQEQEQALAPSEAKDTGLSQDSLNQSTRSRRYGIFADAAEKENEFFTLENENVRVKFSSLGGMVASAELKNYRTFDSLPLIMFQGDSNLFRLQFPTRDNQIVNTNELFFKNEPSRKSNEISLRLYAGAPDKYIEYVYSLAAGEYMLNFKGFDMEHLRFAIVCDIQPVFLSHR